MTLTMIDQNTPDEVIERCRDFVEDDTYQRRMPMAGYLHAALNEVLRLRARLGAQLGTKMKYRRVTLCGSARFARTYREWTSRLMIEQNAMVYTAPLIDGISKDAKERIDLLWCAQIEASDEIFVLDVDGYIGESTAEEIAFAKERGIRVRLLSEEWPGWTDADCRYAPEETGSDAEVRKARALLRDLVAATVNPGDGAPYEDGELPALDAARDYVARVPVVEASNG